MADSFSFCPATQPNCPGCRGNKPWDSDLHYLCDKLLHEIAIRLPVDWEKLGIYLGLSRTKLDSFREDSRNVETFAFEMLWKWWQQQEPKEYWSGELRQALLNIHRNDLIEFSNAYFRSEGISPKVVSNDEQMQKYFQTLASRIPREWRDLGIYLYVPSDDLDSIAMKQGSSSKQNKTLEVLKAWSQQNSNPGQMCQTLNDVLIKNMGRRDVAMYIDEQVKKYKDAHNQYPNNQQRHIQHSCGQRATDPQQMQISPEEMRFQQIREMQERLGPEGVTRLLAQQQPTPPSGPTAPPQPATMQPQYPRHFTSLDDSTVNPSYPSSMPHHSDRHDSPHGNDRYRHMEVLPADTPGPSGILDSAHGSSVSSPGNDPSMSSLDMDANQDYSVQSVSSGGSMPSTEPQRAAPSAEHGIQHGIQNLRIADTYSYSNTMSRNLTDSVSDTDGNLSILEDSTIRGMQEADELSRIIHS